MEGKCLSELKVADLRRELEKRQKDKSGVKPVLIDRLKEALEQDGQDPDSYRFGCDLESSVAGSEANEANSVNEDEAEPGGQIAKSNGNIESTRMEELSEDQTELKKLTEESVPYVVQVGDQEEDLDYDLKAELNGGENVDTDEKSKELNADSSKKSITESVDTSGSASKVSTDLCRNLWVSNLPKTVKAADLKQHFSKIGKVVSATVVMSTRSPGGCFGFLQMSNSDDATKAAKTFDATDFSGLRISVEATERKPPALVTKQAERPVAVSRPKHTTALPKIESKREYLRKRYGAIRRLRPRWMAVRTMNSERFREMAAAPVRPYRSEAYMHQRAVIRRASRLLTASKYGVPRMAYPSTRSPPRASRAPIAPRIPMRRSSPLMERRPIAYNRPLRPEPPVRYPSPRSSFVEERRRLSARLQEEDRYREFVRSRGSSSAPRPRRSEPIDHSVSREWAVPSPMYRRYSRSPVATRVSSEFSRLSRDNRADVQENRALNRSRSRPVPRLSDGPGSMRPRSFQNSTQRIPHEVAPVESQLVHRSRFGRPDGPRRGSSLRNPPAKSPFADSRREYRDISRSPPRSRNAALVRPYPAMQPEYDARRSSRDRSPLHYGGSGNGLRPKVVDYGHRSEPRLDWSGWRGSSGSASVVAPPGHTWKPAGHSLSFSSTRGSSRRYP